MDIQSFSQKLLWPLNQYKNLVSVAHQALFDGAEYQFKQDEKLEYGINYHLNEVAENFDISLIRLEKALNEIEHIVGLRKPVIFKLNIDNTEKLVFLKKSNKLKVELIGPDKHIYVLNKSHFLELITDCSAHYEDNEALGLLEKLTHVFGQAKAEKVVSSEYKEQAGITSWVIEKNVEKKISSIMNKRVLWQLSYTFILEIVVSFLFVLSWYILGHGVITDSWNGSLIFIWSSIIISFLLLSTLGKWIQVKVTHSLSIDLRQYLLKSICKQSLDKINHFSAGQKLSQFIELQSFEPLLLEASIGSITAFIRFVFGVFIFFYIGAYFFSLLTILWGIFLVFCAYRLSYCRKKWTQQRINFSNKLTESMVGHESILAQDGCDDWPSLMAKDLGELHGPSLKLDRLSIWLNLIIPRTWIIVGIVILALVILYPQDSLSVVLMIGGLIFTQDVFNRASHILDKLVQAKVSWELMKHVLTTSSSTNTSASREKIVGKLSSHNASHNDHEHDVPIIKMINVFYANPGSKNYVLEKFNLTLNSKDVITIKGASGSGKSTIAALISGNKTPQSGAILYNGLDIRAMGTNNWKKNIVLVPQFHENYVFCNSLAFNIFIGLDWPVPEEKIELAYEIIRELGLNKLIDKMPLGIYQTVGNGGWPLSHGEKSRLFILRALVQQPEVLILDESLGTLDPGLKLLVKQCCINRVNTVIIISH